jgi:hypothetical protein
VPAVLDRGRHGPDDQEAAAMIRRERDLRRLAREHGFRLERTNSDHWRLRHLATGAIVIASLTPRAADNLRAVRADLRRAERRQEAAP